MDGIALCCGNNGRAAALVLARPGRERYKATIGCDTPMQ